jgi:2-amino-4-hydroxy-6-hydroxymethyldihydropteridine diphosphokinase
MTGAANTQPRGIELPAWAMVTPKRRAHIERVTTLLSSWADALRISPAERDEWLRAGALHDALRDAPDSELRELTGDTARDAEVLHGPAAAARLEALGETNRSVLLAIRYHTVGSAEWDRVGRALFMADFLEPGRSFTRRDRAFLAEHAPHDFDGVFRQVLRARLEYALREGYALFPETVALWNSVR